MQIKQSFQAAQQSPAGPFWSECILKKKIVVPIKKACRKNKFEWKLDNNRPNNTTHSPTRSKALPVYFLFDQAALSIVMDVQNPHSVTRINARTDMSSFQTPRHVQVSRVTTSLKKSLESP